MEVAIDEHIASLPQMLQDEILKYYLTLPEKMSITINESYKPPPQLQIDRKSRIENWHRLYNADTTIHFSGQDQVLVIKWLESLALRDFLQTRLFHYTDLQRDSTARKEETLEIEDALASLHKLRSLFVKTTHRTEPRSIAKVNWGFNLKISTDVIQTDYDTGRDRVVCRNQHDLQIRHAWMEDGRAIRRSWAECWTDYLAGFCEYSHGYSVRMKY